MRNYMDVSWTNARAWLTDAKGGCISGGVQPKYWIEQDPRKIKAPVCNLVELFVGDDMLWLEHTGTFGRRRWRLRIIRRSEYRPDKIGGKYESVTETASDILQSKRGEKAFWQALQAKIQAATLGEYGYWRNAKGGDDV